LDCHLHERAASAPQQLPRPESFRGGVEEIEKSGLWPTIFFNVVSAFSLSRYTLFKVCVCGIGPDLSGFAMTEYGLLAERKKRFGYRFQQCGIP